MSSYFDSKSTEVSDASARFSENENFIRAVAAIEQELIADITIIVGDREFPADLRDKAMSLIAEWHVGTYATLPPRDEAVSFATNCRVSELIERMHSLFHEVASRRVYTRFGLLSDHPKDIRDRRDEHDTSR